MAIIGIINDDFQGIELRIVYTKGKMVGNK